MEGGREKGIEKGTNVVTEEARKRRKRDGGGDEKRE